MLVTIVQNSNTNAGVHKAGCADIRRREVRDRGYLSQWDVEVASQQEAANAAWADFIAEESMTEEDALGYTQFYPCCDGLSPRESQPEGAPSYKNQKDHYIRLMALPGVQRVTVYGATALEEIIPACHGTDHHGHARHQVLIRIGTERWCFRPTEDTYWRPVLRTDLSLCGPVQLTVAASDD